MNPQSAIRNPQSAIRNPQSAIRNPKITISLGLVCCSIYPLAVKAFPIAVSGTEGLKVIVSGTDSVIATYQGNSASYSNDLYLDAPVTGGPIFIFNNHSSSVGSTFNLGSFAVGTELLFRLHVNNTNRNYFSGPADRNPDNRTHARVQGNWQPNKTLVSFEDLFNGPFDYNDLSFSFSNTSTVVFVALNNTKDGTGTGDITSTPAGINCGTTCNANFAANTNVVLTTTPAVTSNFVNWSGACSGAAATCTVAMTAAKSVTATFNLKTYTITFSANPAASGTVAPSGTQVVNYGATKVFTVAAANGYTKSNTVGGTCPQGSWNGNIWTTGAITANCTVLFNFIADITAPTAITNAATNITVNGATLNGSVISNGATATVSFDFGLTSAYGTSIAAIPSNVFSNTAVAVAATAQTGLKCNTTFNYRVKAVNAVGTGYGANQSSKTAACPTPDFLITNITLNPATPTVKGGTFVATVTVKNQGTLAGDGRFLDVWVNQVTNLVCGGKGNLRQSVGSLAVNATKTLTFNGLTTGIAGTKTLRAFVDSSCGTTESNEANNQMVKAYTVQ